MNFDININATIILQVVNFWIAYLIFRFILLKPAYAAIVADNQKKEQLESLVAQDAKRIEFQHQQAAAQWQASYVFFKEHRPQPMVSVMAHRTSMTLSPAATLDARQVMQMRGILCDTIVSAIGARHESR